MKYIKAFFAFVILMIVAVIAFCTEFIAYMAEKLGIAYMAEKLGIAVFCAKPFEKTGNYGGSKGCKKDYWSYETKNSQSQEYQHYSHPDPHLC